MKFLKISAYLAGITAFLAFAVCTVIVFRTFFDMFDRDALSEKEIVKTLKKNHAIFLSDVAENDFSDSSNVKGIQKITAVGDAVDFYCGGKGFGSGTSYFGFYYTPDDLPRAVWSGQKYCDDEYLVPDGDGFSVKEPEGDNYYYTEKITDLFYRYEAYF